jgi:hypothetical protein
VNAQQSPPPCYEPEACQMSSAVQLQGAVFDPAATHVMGEAFDCACRSLRGIGQVGSVREIIAKRIIEVAREGERDPNRPNLEPAALYLYRDWL